jgi:hypothetical protein
MPHILTPSVRLVVASHFFRWLRFFSGVASYPYCLVPILRSSTQGCFKRPVKSSMKMNSSWRAVSSARLGCTLGEGGTYCEGEGDTLDRELCTDRVD